MKTTDGGGPAFPCEYNPLRVKNPELTSAQCRGMSLRDYYAGMAMQGLIPNYRTERSQEGDDALAALSFRIADAMLAARKISVDSGGAGSGQK